MLYDDNGYLNIPEVLNSKQPFIFVVGARGTGKTFGALKYVLQNNIKFGYMRRTQAQADIINKPQFSPLKPVADTLGLQIETFTISRYSSEFCAYEVNEKGKKTRTGDAYGYTLALSTVTNLRGFDMSEMEILIYDEFIPERHEKLLRGEGEALLNCYETINRNRELQGKAPLILLCLANSNTLVNPVFDAFGITSKAEQMARKGQTVSIMDAKGIALYILNKSPISAKKANTALYNAADNEAFRAMALDNNFNMNRENVAAQPIREYKPYIAIGEISIYKHKSTGAYYVTRRGRETIKEIGLKEISKYKQLAILYINNKVTFSDYQTKTKFLLYFGIDKIEGTL